MVFQLLTVPAVAAAANRAKSTLSGEGSVSAAYTSGNTNTTDVGAALKAAKQFRDWDIRGKLEIDYGENSGIESRNRWALAAQFDRKFGDRWHIYGRGTYEEDKFSGFESRLFVGTGAGYKIIAGNKANWTLEAGPGYRRDVIVPSGRVEGKISTRIGSSFGYKFNKYVDFSNDTEWVYSDVSTQRSNIAALTAKLTDKFATRFSFEVRNESNPPFSRKPTDTITRFSLVYGL